MRSSLIQINQNAKNNIGKLQLKGNGSQTSEDAVQMYKAFSFCDSNNIKLLATPEQLGILNNLSEESISYTKATKLSQSFMSRLYMLNLKTILQTSIIAYTKKSFGKNKQVVANAERQLAELNNIGDAGFSKAFNFVFFDKKTTYSLSKTAKTHVKPKSIDQIESAFEAAEKISAIDSAVLERLKKEYYNYLNSGQITKEDMSHYLKTLADSENLKGIVAGKKSVGKKILKSIVVLLFSFGITFMTVAMASDIEMGDEDLSSVEQSTKEDQDALEIDSIVKDIIDNEFYDYKNLSEFTTVDYYSFFTVRSDEMKPQSSENVELIVAKVNKKIEEIKANSSKVELAKGEGYEASSSHTYVRDDLEFDVTYKIDPEFEYDDEQNKLVISNAKYDSIDPKVVDTGEETKIIYTLKGIKIEDKEKSVGFSLGDLEKAKSGEVVEMNIEMDQNNKYGVFLGVSNTENIDYDTGFSFSFKVNDAYTQTAPVFNANGEKLVVEKIDDSVYKYSVSKNTLKKGEDIKITDETNWKINKYNLTAESGEGWKFDGLPEHLVHGKDTMILMSLENGYEGLPVIKVNGKEITYSQDSVYGFMSFVINAKEDTSIKGEDLEKTKEETPQDNQGGLDQTSTEEKNNYDDYDESGANLGR